MESIISLLATLNSLSPLAVIALLGLVLYVTIYKQPSRSDLDTIKSNHLHELPQIAKDLRRMSDTMQRMETNMSTSFAAILGRMDRRREKRPARRSS